MLPIHVLCPLGCEEGGVGRSIERTCLHKTAAGILCIFFAEPLFNVSPDRRKRTGRRHRESIPEPHPPCFEDTADHQTNKQCHKELAINAVHIFTYLLFLFRLDRVRVACSRESNDWGGITKIISLIRNVIKQSVRMKRTGYPGNQI